MDRDCLMKLLIDQISKQDESTENSEDSESVQQPPLSPKNVIKEHLIISLFSQICPTVTCSVNPKQPENVRQYSNRKLQNNCFNQTQSRVQLTQYSNIHVPGSNKNPIRSNLFKSNQTDKRNPNKFQYEVKNCKTLPEPEKNVGPRTKTSSSSVKSNEERLNKSNSNDPHYIDCDVETKKIMDVPTFRKSVNEKFDHTHDSNVIVSIDETEQNISSGNIVSDESEECDRNSPRRRNNDGRFIRVVNKKHSDKANPEKLILVFSKCNEKSKKSKNSNLGESSSMSIQSNHTRPSNKKKHTKTKKLNKNNATIKIINNSSRNNRLVKDAVKEKSMGTKDNNTVENLKNISKGTIMNNYKVQFKTKVQLNSLDRVDETSTEQLMDAIIPNELPIGEQNSNTNNPLELNTTDVKSDKFKKSTNKKSESSRLLGEVNHMWPNLETLCYTSRRCRTKPNCKYTDYYTTYSSEEEMMSNIEPVDLNRDERVDEGQSVLNPDIKLDDLHQRKSTKCTKSEKEQTQIKHGSKASLSNNLADNKISTKVTSKVLLCGELNDESNSQVADKMVKCKFCHYVNTELEVVRHYRKWHVDKEVPSRLPKNVAEALIEESLNNDYASSYSVPLEDSKICVYSCVFCRFIYTDFLMFYNHITGHTGEYRYACKMCEEMYSNENELEQHILTHSDDLDKTNETFDLLYHNPIKCHDIFGYMCSFCFFVQLDYNNVVQHMTRWHFDEDKRINGRWTIIRIKMSDRIDDQTISSLIDYENLIGCSPPIPLSQEVHLLRNKTREDEKCREKNITTETEQKLQVDQSSSIHQSRIQTNPSDEIIYLSDDSTEELSPTIQSQDDETSSIHQSRIQTDPFDEIIYLSDDSTEELSPSIQSQVDQTSSIPHSRIQRDPSNEIIYLSDDSTEELSPSIQSQVDQTSSIPHSRIQTDPSNEIIYLSDDSTEELSPSIQSQVDQTSSIPHSRIQTDPSDEIIYLSDDSTEELSPSIQSQVDQTSSIPHSRIQTDPSNEIIYLSDDSTEELSPSIQSQVDQTSSIPHSRIQTDPSNEIIYLSDDSTEELSPSIQSTSTYQNLLPCQPVVRPLQLIGDLLSHTVPNVLNEGSPVNSHRPKKKRKKNT